MNEPITYKSGLLHLIQLLTMSEGGSYQGENDRTERVLKAENIDKSFIEDFYDYVSKTNEAEIFRQTVKLMSQCPEEYKIRAFFMLFKLAEIDKRMKKREIQLLQYACTLTASQMLNVKLLVDEQKVKLKQTCDIIHVVGGHEIDVFILEKLMSGYLINIEIEFHPHLKSSHNAFLDGKQRPKLVILNLDPMRFYEEDLLDEIAGNKFNVPVYILTLSHHLFSKTFSSLNNSKIKGVFEKPLTDKEIKQIADQNKLQYVEWDFSTKKILSKRDENF